MSRPPDQRLREYKYRFGQSIVFGLPVLALQFYGRALGPTDSERWVSLLQALLAGWVLYVNLGMLFEGILLLPTRRITGDFVVSIVAAALYLYSFTSAAHGVVTSRLLFRPLLFHICVIVLAAWTGWRWWRQARTSATQSFPALRHSAPLAYVHQPANDARDCPYESQGRRQTR